MPSWSAAAYADLVSIHGTLRCNRSPARCYDRVCWLRRGSHEKWNEQSTTGDCCFAVCQSTRQSPICTRHSDVGKGVVCRVPFIGHTAKCAKADPRQKKQKTWEVTWRPPLPCACRRGTWQSSNVCRVPWLWHMVNIGFFAVCHGFCTRQRSLILYFLFVYCVYGTPNNTNNSHIS